MTSFAFEKTYHQLLDLTDTSTIVSTDEWQPGGGINTVSYTNSINNTITVALIIYDLETTATASPCIVEIAAWNVVSNTTFHSLVNPLEANNPVYGTGIHRLTDEELAAEQTWEVVGKKFLRWFEEEQFASNGTRFQKSEIEHSTKLDILQRSKPYMSLIERSRMECANDVQEICNEARRTSSSSTIGCFYRVENI